MIRFNKFCFNCCYDQGEFGSVKHIYTEWQPDVHEFLGSWRDFIETYSLQTGRRVYSLHMHYYLFNLFGL